MMLTNANGRAVGAGTDTTLRGTNLYGVGMLLGSNGPVSPAGSRTLIATGQSPGNYAWASVIASFRPA